MTFKELISIFKTHYNLSRPADLARELGVSPQVVSNWKARNQVPYKYIMMIREKIESENIEFLNKSKDNNDQKQKMEDHKMIPTQVFYPSFVDPDSISIKEILLIIQDNLKVFLVFPVICLVTTIIFVYLIAAPTYSSSTTIIPASGESSKANFSGLASQFGFTVPGISGDSKKLVYPEIIKSRTISKKMLKKRFYTKKYGQKETLLKLLTYGNEEPEVGLDTLEIFAMNKFIESINVFDDKKSSIITVTVDAFEPQLARDIVLELIEELDNHQKRFNTEQAAKKRIFIEDRIIEVQKDLEGAEEKLKEWRQRNRNIKGSPALLLEQERLLREAEVQKQIFITLKQEFEMAQIEEVEESDILYVLDYPEVPLVHSWPKRIIYCLFSLIFGTGISLLYIFSKNYFLTIQSANESPD